MSHARVALAFVGYFFVVISAITTESTNQWYLRGPDSGYAGEVAIDKVSSRPMAGGASGVFVYDAGLSRWQFSNAGVPTPFIGDVAVSATATFVNSGGYVSRTIDGGATWLNVSSVLMGGQVSTIATSPAAATRVYAAVDPGDGSPNGGLWVSNDLGNTWTQSAVTAGGNIVLVRVSPTNANRVFVAGQADPNTGVANLFRSTDGGTSFQGPVAMTGGDVNTIGLVQFNDVAQDPFDANHMIAVAGQTDPVLHARYGELWASSDAGQTWSMTTPAFQIPPDMADQAEPYGVLFDRYVQGTVYYATAWGVFQSTTGGGSPTLSSTGLPRLGVNANGAQPYDAIEHLAQDTDANHTLYAASVSDGIYGSTDGAANWSSMNTGYTGLNFRIMAFQPGGTNVVLAGASDPSTASGVYRSTDGGTTWTRSASGMNADVIRGLAFAPAPNTNVVLAAGYKPQQVIGGETNRGFWRSTDSGQSWSAITNSGMPRTSAKRIIQFDPNDGNRVLVATGAGIVLSTDAGQTWTTIAADGTNGLPTQAGGLLGLAASPGPVSGTRFYAGFISDPSAPVADGGVYYSDDGGYNWTASNPLPNGPDAFYFSIAPTAGTLYMARTDYASSQGGVLKSTNYGVDWVDVTDAILPRATITVAADPVDPNVVWAGSIFSDIAHPGGIFRSNDGGAHWVPYDRGLRIPIIMWFVIDPADHNHLLAGGPEGMHEMHFAPDADQDGIPDTDESQFASGDANGDGTPDATQSNVASVGTTGGTSAPFHAPVPAAPGDYVVVELDKSAPYTGTCDFVSDLQVIGTDIVPISDRMVQVAPTIRFSLPDCTTAHVKIRYSAVTSYPVGVFGSYSPAVAGDATRLRWGMFDPTVASVDGNGVWTIALDQNAYGDVYAPNSGSILFQGAPGRDSIFADGFGN
jgi:photosystem II stability/assembly factor-like uncharacterized protein